ncbi:NAD(P)H-binding protein [Saccharopolyspora sp. NPDC002686]|uniref:NAD(P)H-binding protein n=1 Tax=Saccharopolyspora sp. NPDC002686 TaxID=3154541 RepID=UPI003322017E
MGHGRGWFRAGDRRGRGIGNAGGKVVGLLRERGFAVRAMAYHDDDRVEALRSLGAEVVVGDLAQRADVVRALDGVRRMFFAR